VILITPHPHPMMHRIHNLDKVLQKGKLDVSVSHFGPTYFPEVEAVQNCHVQEVKNLSLGSFITSELISQVLHSSIFSKPNCLEIMCGSGVTVAVLGTPLCLLHLLTLLINPSMGC